MRKKICAIIWKNRKSKNVNFRNVTLRKDNGIQETFPWVGKIPWRRKSYPVQYSGLENSTDYIIYGISKSRTQLRDFHFQRGFDLWC